MENATKAVLITLLVLVIIIIFLILGVVRESQKTIKSVDVSQAEMYAHNSKFLSYEGTNLTTADVNAFLNALLVHNRKQLQQNTGQFVVLDFDYVAEQQIGLIHYTIECYLTDGLVRNICVTMID